jgi:hypothetical protein
LRHAFHLNLKVAMNLIDLVVDHREHVRVAHLAWNASPTSPSLWAPRALWSTGAASSYRSGGASGAWGATRAAFVARTLLF